MVRQLSSERRSARTAMIEPLEPRWLLNGYWEGAWNLTSWRFEVEGGHGVDFLQDNPQTVMITDIGGNQYKVDPQDADTDFTLSYHGDELRGDFSGPDEDGDYQESYMRVLDIGTDVALVLYAQGGFDSPARNDLWWGFGLAGVMTRGAQTTYDQPWAGEFQVRGYWAEATRGEGGGSGSTDFENHNDQVRLEALGGGQYQVIDLQTGQPDDDQPYTETSGRLERHETGTDQHGTYYEQHEIVFRAPNGYFCYFGGEVHAEHAGMDPIYGCGFWAGVCVPWSTTSVGTTGSANDIAYDAQGNLHFAWFDHTNGDLRYAEQSAATGQWSAARVVDAESPEVGQYVSMALDSSGRPGLAYYDAYNADLKYASYNGVTWDVETVHSRNSTGMYPSLAYDGSDNPVIAYYQPTGGFLLSASRSGGAWGFAIIDGEAAFAGGPAGTEDVGRYPSLAMHPATGQWAVAYENTSTGVFKYAERSGGGTWTAVTYDADTQNGGGYVSLAFDALNAPCVSYYDSHPADLKYARRSGGAWQCETVAAKSSQGLYTSLWFEGSDARIAYWFKNGDNLVLAGQSGGTWTFDTLVPSAGREARVAINPLKPLGGTDYLAASWYVGSSQGLGCGVVM